MYTANNAACPRIRNTSAGGNAKKVLLKILGVGGGGKGATDRRLRWCTLSAQAPGRPHKGKSFVGPCI